MRSLLFACVAIALIAVSAPGLMTRYLDRPATAAPTLSTVESASSGEEEAPSHGVTPLSQVAIEAAPDGHFYVSAEVNFRPIRLMVDTGATVMALRRSDAQAVGIRLVNADFASPVTTANGTAYAAEAELESVLIENIEISDVRALVLPDEQLPISLLGASFLNRLVRFEVANGVLIFEN